MVVTVGLTGSFFVDKPSAAHHFPGEESAVESMGKECCIMVKGAERYNGRLMRNEIKEVQEALSAA